MSETTETSPDNDRGPVPPAEVVLISGASRGLGLAIATDAAERGVNVAAFARTVSAEMKELADDHPGRVHLGAVDITDTTATQAFVREVESRFGVVDALVNNAAIGQDSLHVHTSQERIAEILETNLTAPLLLARLVVRRMLGRGVRGRILNVTSICGQRGFPGLVAYSAAKGGMDAATRSLARELGGRVLVNAVAPGFFASEMSAVLGSTQLDAIRRRTPSGQMTTPADVLPVVRMLLWEQTNINGETVVVDGGGSI
ncbi:SDR family NAD(P)-dependent oxidoreductase [Nocardioides insulae]|uniref:SDR family NAD(P)-dependent oxidoreductase n=1 Tax=Nocardioides insulae TaxID=394734 RepID=UPI0003F4F6E3|nr:SDR family oxidoreductase [Nocardioides insulae]